MIIMKIRATIPGIGDYEGEMTFESLKDAVKYVEDDMFYGQEKPYMALVKSEPNTAAIIVTHGGMSFAIIVKEDTATHEELGE